ncbi:SusD/RagB family nutrient-binding outer membrane lipoprotein [Fulvivirga maritima]|uniref:SusD/RagB family nutrient-binding outer membrane lipoprotein n=1 Tax=Fulvivirga maritima TaxID=2904247 RepID=UPI001F230B19|nr:SusD/RagB family nutrient-binding outer membrane lipoprotein [Fulvivirga maritima]UII24481.1 SusD/RagB family nutrient-binding outer membrane lipoprotein [Fulvivirga maritima]
MKLRYIITLLLIIGVSFSCDEFEDMNENPNEPTDVDASTVLPSAIRQSVTTLTTESFLLGNNAAQLTAKTLRTEIDSYNWNAFPSVWQGLYESLTDVRTLEEIALEEENEALEGVAVILRSWIMSTLTNTYGNVPYTEAIDGSEGDYTPAYDDQSAIYADILDELERADGLLTGSGSISGDIMLNNDPTLWRKFGNSLRLRLLMYAHNQIDDAESRFANIVESGLILSSNEETVAMPFLNSFPNQFPTIPLKKGDFDAVALSQTSLNVMSAYNDPRLARYARPDNNDYNNPTFSGATNGAGSCSKGGSALGAPYFNVEGDVTADELGLNIPEGLVMTYSEVEFLLAEAAAKGWIADAVEPHYEAGIEASMEYYQVDYAPFGYTDFADYYANSGVAYNEATDIWEQKWLALFFNGLEPYFEVRRWYFESGMSFDGIPFMDPACNNLNNNLLPTRFLYPGEEQSLNQLNYQEAIERMDGGNSINAPIWLVQ